VKEDAVPGRTNYFWIRTTDLGNFYASCAEYCGLNHSYMYAPVVIVEEEKFLVWKNYFPPDTTKIDTVKPDSLKSTFVPTDTSKLSVNLDSLRRDTTVPAIKKPDSLRK
jgi:heme/copper-type cytochrome/quinol oxidase subunit 2